MITTGPLPPNPAELLGSQRMRTILERLAAGADLVVIDSPPLQAVTDAAILASIADGTVFIVDAGRTRRGAVRSGREALAKAGARVLGVVLNRLPRAVQRQLLLLRLLRRRTERAEAANRRTPRRRPRRPESRDERPRGATIGVRVLDRRDQLPTGAHRDRAVHRRPRRAPGRARRHGHRDHGPAALPGLADRHGHASGRSSGDESIDGVTVVRAAHYVPTSQDAIRRAVYEGTFGLTGLLAGVGVERPDAILGVVPSLSGGLLARILARRHRAPYGLLFQDLMGPAAQPVRHGRRRRGRERDGTRPSAGRSPMRAPSASSRRRSSRTSARIGVPSRPDPPRAELDAARRTGDDGRGDAGTVRLGRWTTRSSSTPGTSASSRVSSRSWTRLDCPPSAATPSDSSSPAAGTRRGDPGCGRRPAERELPRRSA